MGVPSPLSFLTPGAYTPYMLDGLSSTTTIVGAWSSGRALKRSVYGAGAMKVRSNEAGTQTTVGFSGGLLNVTTLLAACVATQKLGVIQWNDQSGNGNHMAPQSGAADCVIASTTGTLTHPTTVLGGASMPMIGFGAGNQSGGTGSAPNMSTAQPMPVSFGAVSQHFMLGVFIGTSGSGDAHGEIANFVHTGDTNSFSATTSCIHLQRNNSSTSGAYCNFNYNGFKATQTITEGFLHLGGSLFDGADMWVYADKSPGGSVANTQSLGSGGRYAIGACAGLASTDPWCGFIGEVVVGTFTNSASSFRSGDFLTMENNMRSFWKTP